MQICILNWINVESMLNPSEHKFPARQMGGKSRTASRSIQTRGLETSRFKAHNDPSAWPKTRRWPGEKLQEPRID